MTENLKHLNLSEPMKQLLLSTTSRERVPAGPTRAALMRRGLVHKFGTGAGLDCKLTAEGLKVRNLLFADEPA